MQPQPSRNCRHARISLYKTLGTKTHIALQASSGHRRPFQTDKVSFSPARRRRRQPPATRETEDAQLGLARRADECSAAAAGISPRRSR
eukprot:1918796-Pleurochrysis_carterae.AAC.2